jgi:uncharacterized membrane protein
MQRSKKVFIVSLIVIVLLSIIDNRYFSFTKAYGFPTAVRQTAHFTCFFITAAIGYYNWKGREKWMAPLWLTLYGLALLFIVVMGALLYFISGHHVSQQWANMMTAVRQTFLGPIPFLVFSLLPVLIRQLSQQGQQD